MTQDDRQRPTRLSTDDARQGVTGHHVRTVLAVGLLLALLAGTVLWFTVGVP